jgi:translation initiation factor 2B subunit (eIF-2B alpha/beta/delta family)
MKKILLLIIVLLFIYGEARSSSSDSLRCGSELVALRDTKVEVMTKCGKPSFREQTSSRRGKIEKWYYDKGPGDFIYVLILHSGILKYVEQAGRGK